MPGEITIKAMSAWENDIEVPMSEILRVSMDTMERTGDEACKHAIILMAQSARAMTPRAKKNRPVLRASTGTSAKGATKATRAFLTAPYVEVWHQGATEPSRIYKFQYDEDARVKLPGTWENAQTIGNVGTAQRSWMWGLGRLGAAGTGKAMPGASKVYKIDQEKVHGYIKENRLGYIQAIMPGGWEAEVSTRAGNKIMGQARARLEQLWPSVAEGAVK